MRIAAGAPHQQVKTTTIPDLSLTRFVIRLGKISWRLSHDGQSKSNKRTSLVVTVTCSA
jgi:hypothetical protein